LIRPELWTTPSDAAVFTGGIQSGLCSLAQYCSLELGKRSDHLHHHAARSSGRIDRLRQTPEPRFSFLNAFHDHQHVVERAGKSVKTRDNQYIALPQLIQQAMELGSVLSPARCLLPENLLTARGLQRRDLCGGIPLVGGNTRIS